jgi:hypothetical protein
MHPVVNMEQPIRSFALPQFKERKSSQASVEAKACPPLLLPLRIEQIQFLLNLQLNPLVGFVFSCLVGHDQVLEGLIIQLSSASLRLLL